MNVQDDPNLPWVHMSEVTFSDVVNIYLDKSLEIKILSI